MLKSEKLCCVCRMQCAGRENGVEIEWYMEGESEDGRMARGKKRRNGRQEKGKVVLRAYVVGCTCSGCRVCWHVCQVLLYPYSL